MTTAQKATSTCTVARSSLLLALRRARVSLLRTPIGGRWLKFATQERGGSLRIDGPQMSTHIAAESSLNWTTDTHSILGPSVDTLRRALVLMESEMVVLHFRAPRLTVESGPVTFTVGCESQPAVAQQPVKVWQVIDASKLRPALITLCDVASRDHLRYGLNGISIERYEGGHRLIATDGHRLAAVEMGQGLEAEPTHSQLHGVSRKFAVAMRDVLMGLDSPELHLRSSNGTHYARLSAGNFTMWGEWVGEFPQWRPILPNEHSVQGVRVSLNRAKLRRALQLTMLVSQHRRTHVALKWQGGAVLLERTRHSTSHRQSVAGAVSALTSGSIGVDPGYLLWACKRLKGLEVTLEVRGELAAVLIREGSLLIIVMPMRMD